MNELEKIKNKNPLLLADDDHPDRKDISAEEFSKALDQIAAKHNQFDQPETQENDFAEAMEQATIDALNKV